MNATPSTSSTKSGTSLFLAPKTNLIGDNWEVYYEEQAPFWDEQTARCAFYRKQVLHNMRYCIPKGSRVLEIGCATGTLLNDLEPSHGVGIDFAPGMIDRARSKYDHLTFHVASAEEFETDEAFDFIVMEGLLGCLHDVEYVLHRVAKMCQPQTRVVLTYHNALYEPLFGVAETFGYRREQPIQNWISDRQVANLLKLADFNLIRIDHRHFCPFDIPGANFLERVVGRLPFFKHLNLMSYVVARTAEIRREEQPTVSVICPCRNEKGNIENAVKRLPAMGRETELIFVEGNSRDGTYEECQRVLESYPDHNLKLIQQGDGVGKGDAVRKGFAQATGDILMILDADLTAPPEELPKFYNAIVSEKGEFINGTRMVYPMERQAMRFLNKLGNKFFSWLFTWILGQPLTDTLCGTKVMWRKDYDRLAANRAYFGEFDPFGDYDLIFGSAKLGLEIVEVPVRYRDRTYGSTNIDRFRHGLLLLRMSWIAMRKIRFY